MSKYTPKATPKKPAAKEAPKLSQPKVWRAEDYVNSNVSIEEVRDIKNAFDIFDTDSSGLIDPQELRKAFISLGFDLANKVTLTQLNDLVEENPEGLDFGNFLNLATGKLGETHTRAEINKIFSAFDNTRAGKITAQQFKAVTQELGEYLTEEQIEKIFEKTDLDGDGFVTAEDIYLIMSGSNKEYYQ